MLGRQAAGPVVEVVVALVVVAVTLVELVVVTLVVVTLVVVTLVVVAVTVVMLVVVAVRVVAVVVVVVMVFVVVVATASSDEPSTADRLPVKLNDKPVSPRAVAACFRNGVFVDRLLNVKAASPTPKSSEIKLSSNVTAPVSAKRRPPATVMLIAPGGSIEAFATALAKESSAVISKPRVRPSNCSVCRKPTTCKVQSFKGLKEPCK